MKPHAIEGLPQNPTESVKRLNPHLWPTSFAVGQFQPEITQSQAERPLVGKPPGRKKGKAGVVTGGPRFRVTLTNYRRRLLDSDNLIGGSFKHLRDAIAQSLGVDDADRFIEWQYGQELTKGIEGTVTIIEQLF